MCQACLASLSRRRFILGALGAGVAISTAALADNAVSTPQNAISGEAALELLMQGNARYATNLPRERDYSAGRAERAEAQYPIAAVLSCSDSRVAPEFVFDQGPGDVFVVRIAGNIVKSGGLASLEYSVHYLGAPLILVLGHSQCGAVASAIKVLKENAQLPGHLPELIAAIKPAAEAAKNAADPLAAAITENVRLSVKQIVESDPVISPLVADKKVKIAGGVYDIATGKVALVA